MISTKTLVQVTCVAVLSEVIYQVSTRIYYKLKSKFPPNTLTHALIERYKTDCSSAQFHKVIFFPDSGLACRRSINGRVCKNQNCFGVHEETSLTVLLSVLNFSKKSLDVCVYMITCSILGDALIACQERGVAIRIITEERNSGEEGEMIGSQIGKLRAAGINVRCRSSSFWMHHKFLVADNEILVNGSFNWTNQAVMGNFENLIITSETNLVNPFHEEFQRLWDKLTPIDFVAE